MLGHNPFYQNYPQNNLAQQNARDERIFVSNQQAAEAYIVAANSFVRLWDSSQPRFYEKTADYTGRPMAMRIFEYKEVSATPEAPINYVSAEEFTEFKEHVNDFMKSFETKEVKKNAKQSSTANADA